MDSIPRRSEITSELSVSKSNNINLEDYITNHLSEWEAIIRSDHDTYLDRLITECKSALRQGTLPCSFTLCLERQTLITDAPKKFAVKSFIEDMAAKGYTCTHKTVQDEPDCYGPISYDTTYTIT